MKNSNDKADQQRSDIQTFYEDADYADRSFGLVTCIESLEHCIDPVGCLREVSRAAKPDAQIVISVSNLDFLTRQPGIFWDTYQVVAKEEVSTLDEWGRMFVQTGVRVASRWKDLHVLVGSSIAKVGKLMWPMKALQTLLMKVWPLRWNYGVYHKCSIHR